MAAGSGSRYGKLKQFDDLGPEGEFLMEFGIFDAIKHGFTHIVAITKSDNVSFLKNHLASRLPKHIKLDVLAQTLEDLPSNTTYKSERIKPWGTAHAVWTARDVIKGAFAVLNADDFYGENAFKNAAKIIGDGNSFGLISYTLKDTLSSNGSVSRGVCKTENNILISINERLKLQAKDNSIIDEDTGLEFSGDEQVSMNFWVCDPSIFNFIEKEFIAFLGNEEKIKSSELYLPMVIQEMMVQKGINVATLNSEDNWFGVTYADDREMAVAVLDKMTKTGKYPHNLWKNN